MMSSLSTVTATDSIAKKDAHTATLCYLASYFFHFPLVFFCDFFIFTVCLFVTVTTTAYALFILASSGIT